MPSHSLNQAYHQASSDVPCSSLLRDLIDRWAMLEAGTSDDTPANISPSADHAAANDRFAFSHGALDGEREQARLLESILAHPSQTANDALAKLILWKTIACPTAPAERNLSPADRLILSALNDLLSLRR